MISSAEEFIQLRTSGNSSEYLRAATEEAPIEVWHEIVERHPDMRSWVAYNKTVPVEILASLACDPSPDVRHSVAMKNKLTLELMSKLADDEDESVRRGIAHNKKTPAEVLRKLAMDRLPDIAEIAEGRLRAVTADPAH
jgi:hypothetical protein